MCMAAGIDPPAHVQVHGWLLLGGEKMSKSSVNQITPGDLIAEYGVDPVRYHLLRDIPLGSDGEFSAEGIAARYNADLANNLGNLLSRVATVVGSKCGGLGPAPSADSRLAGVAAAVLAEASEAWEAGQPHLALEATWRLIRETNAELETAEPWKAEPGPGGRRGARQRARGAADRVDPHRAGHAGHRRGGLAADRAARGRRPTSACPTAGAWGGYPAGPPVEKGAPLFPRRKA